MLGDLPESVIGTNPIYLPVIDHSWLAPNPANYDNYPSDNNSVRVLPKLAELWGTKESTGINLIPNQGVSQPCGCRSATDTDVVEEIVRDAKQAMMLGYKGKDFVAHLRSRHSSEKILKAKEALEKLASEQGLLGNVYIDASAFASAREAEEFLKLHRARLARDIEVNASKINANVISMLASKFRKNVVASVDYNEELFNQYKTHLVEAGRINKDFVINSKETLRDAFLYVKPKQVIAKATPQKVNGDLSSKEFSNEKLSNQTRFVQEELDFKVVRPIITFAREQLAKGKTRDDLKEMLRVKYAANDLKQSGKYLAMVISDQGLAAETVDKLVTTNEVPDYIGEELKKLGRQYPIKVIEAVEKKVARNIGQQGFFHNLTGKSSVITNLPKIPGSTESQNFQDLAVDALRKGNSIQKVASMLVEGIKYSSNECTLTLDGLPVAQAKEVLAGALKAFNASPIGVKANAPVKVAKEKAPELKKKETLPDPSTIEAKSNEIISFFKGANTNIDFDTSLPVSAGNLEVADLGSHSGLDSIMEA